MTTDSPAWIEPSTLAIPVATESVNRASRSVKYGRFWSGNEP